MIVRHTEFTSEVLGFDTTDVDKPFVLKEKVNVHYAKDDIKADFNISKKFRSDGVTIKNKLLQYLICCPHDPRYIPAAIIHDYLVDTKITDRQTASEIFKEVLIQHGVDQLKAQIMFLTVEFWQKYIRGWK